MAENRFSRILLRRGTKATLEAINPLLREGEPIVELDTGRLKTGNGIDRYKKLRYVGGGSGSGIPAITLFDITGATSTNSTTYNSRLVPNGATINELELSYIITAQPDILKIISDSAVYLDIEYPDSLSDQLVLDDLSLTDNRTYKLIITTNDSPIEKTVTLSFCPYYYYGVSDNLSPNYLGATISYSNTNLTTFTKNLVPSRSITTNIINSGAGEYIYILLPNQIFNKTEYVTFTDLDNSFVGGFMLLDSQNPTIITNEYNIQETFNVYRSSNHSLGNKRFRIT